MCAAEWFHSSGIILGVVGRARGGVDSSLEIRIGIAEVSSNVTSCRTCRWSYLSEVCSNYLMNIISHIRFARKEEMSFFLSVMVG